MLSGNNSRFGEQIGCDAVATGHYARNSYGENLEGRSTNTSDLRINPAFLLKSVDRTKDQTFFLSQIHQDALRNSIFPVGELTKELIIERYYLNMD